MSDVRKFDAMEELKNNIKDSIILETLRMINSNMDCYKDKMLEVCTYLYKKHGIDADGITRVLDGVSDNYVFYLMHGSEYASWIQLGVNCQKYADKRQIYIAHNYDNLKP